MFKKAVYGLLFATLGLYVFRLLFFWVHEGTDSYFYWMLSSFFKTGQYFAPYPYVYSRPSTMEPPFYSVFLYIFQLFPNAEIIIHFVQTLSILISAFLLFCIMKHYIRKEWAVLLAVFFLLTPAHIIYISLLVAEPIAVLMLCIFLFLLHKIAVEKKHNLLALLLVYSPFMVLQRYNFLTFFLTGILVYLFQRKKTLIDTFALLTGMGIIAGWILINHSWNGAWGLSNSEGKHLYNRIVLFDKLLPSEDSPEMKRMREITSPTFNMFQPWWFVEPVIMPYLNYDETASSKEMERFALAALKTDPLRYFRNIPGYFIYAHGENDTYHSPAHLWTGEMPNYCRTLGNIQFCRPIIESRLGRQVWDMMVKTADFYYMNFFKHVNYFILFPSILFALIQKKKFFRILALLYIFSVTFFVMAEAPLPRYTYNFTVIKTMLMGFGIYNLLRFIRKSIKYQNSENIKT